VTDYNHFQDTGINKRCPLHDDVEARHEQEVKKAADAAMAKVKAENPGLSDADLMVKVSDRVKQEILPIMSCMADNSRCYIRSLQLSMYLFVHL
jgi:hypothetical protein